jgi:hypothetical protein
VSSGFTILGCVRDGTQRFIRLDMVVDNKRVMFSSERMEPLYGGAERFGPEVPD